MTRWRRTAALGAFLVFGLTLSACSGQSEPAGRETTATAEPETMPATSTDGATTVAEDGPMEIGTPHAGGVYRVGVEGGFNFTNGFDPTGEYFLDANRIFSNLLIRTLLTPKHTAGPAGNQVIPDLAVGLPEVSPDGLTYTFKLKDGIRFGPPVNREITSRDIAYAFERIGTPSLVAQYGFYYDVIEGMQAFKEGKADTISGIETPDEWTIVFHLTEPTGDFLYRLALPATGPIPEEVAHCFSEPGDYGRFVIASGPYMIEGSENLEIGSCDTLEPISGYDPNASLTLARNPSYDPATDTTQARESFPDRFEFTINTNANDIFRKIEAGELDAEIASTPPSVVREYTQNPELEDRFRVNPADAIFFISMNLTQPPFDDVHVRRAVNFAMDRLGLQQVNGGPTAGEIAAHMLPDTLLDDKLVDSDPFSAKAGGDIDAAREEMKQSKYDTDGDGLCDAPECKGVLHVAAANDANRRMTPVIEESLRRIGITLDTRQFADAFSIVQDVAKNVPISSVGGWGKDYPDPSTFVVVFDGRSIQQTGNPNYSLVGLTAEEAGRLKGLTGTTTGIPSVDADIERCKPLEGDARLDCWVALDRKLTEKVVPWVPYLQYNDRDTLGPAVTRYDYDQFFGGTAFAHVAVDPAEQ